MSRIFALVPLLKRFADGSIIRNTFAWVFRILAFTTVVTVVVFSVKLWIDTAFYSTEITILTVLSQIVLIVWGFSILNVFWMRASDIHDSHDDPEYAVTPIFVVFIRTVGELAGFSLLAIGLQICFAQWLGLGATFVLPTALGTIFGGFMSLGFTVGTGFLGGLLALVWGVVMGFLAIVIGYFVAELVGAFVAIARNTKRP